MSVIEVPRATFALTDPWAAPLSATAAPLLDSRNGKSPRLATSVRVWRDRVNLYLLFAGDDDHVVATYTGRDEPLWQEDVVEAFLAPVERSHYFELEVSPRGTLFDARIVSPEGSRKTMQVDRSWDCEGLFAAVRIEKEHRLEVLIGIPFAGLGRPEPRPGERWLGNFYRIDRHPGGDEFTAWKPTMRTPPDFHVPAAFGELVFL
jgi:hypothetical protein